MGIGLSNKFYFILNGVRFFESYSIIFYKTIIMISTK